MSAEPTQTAEWVCDTLKRLRWGRERLGRIIGDERAGRRMCKGSLATPPVILDWLAVLRGATEQFPAPNASEKLSMVPFTGLNDAIYELSWLTADFAAEFSLSMDAARVMRHSSVTQPVIRHALEGRAAIYAAHPLPQWRDKNYLANLRAAAPPPRAASAGDAP